MLAPGDRGEAGAEPFEGVPERRPVLEVRGLARLARVAPTVFRWRKEAGPFFGNQIGELVLEGRSARFVLSVTERSGTGERLRQVLDLPVSPG